MELWRELLIGGLYDEHTAFNCANDEKLVEIIKNQCYKVLLQIKQVIDDETLSDKDCFIKIEEILGILEKNHIYCNRHDFG